MPQKHIIHQAIDIYEFNELSEKAQDKVFGDWLEFIKSTETVDDEMYDLIQEAIEEAEANKTPWFIDEILLENPVIASQVNILANSALYTIDGEFVKYIKK